MTETAFKQRFEELINNEKFTSQLKGLKNRDEIQALFVSNGLPLTDEMLDGIMGKIQHYEETGELDEETLAAVSGGKFSGWFACTVFGAAIGATYGGGYGAIAGAVIGCVAYFVIT